MRFLHLGDVHFGASWRGISKTQALMRDSELLATFDRALDLGLKENVDAILIAGDLFDSPLPHYGLVQEVKYRLAHFRVANGPRILITPGNHDPWVDGSPYAGQWPAYVTIFGEDWEAVEVAGRLVRGFGFQRHGIRDCPMPNQFAEQTDILVLHADWQAGNGSNYCPIQPEHLARAGASYTAFGHIHKSGIVWNKNGQVAAYCGSLEPLGFDERGQHGVWLGSLTTELKLEFVPLATREVKTFAICVDKCQARTEFSKLVLNTVPPAERHHYCVINWEGEVDPRLDIPMELKEIEQDFFALRFENNTRPGYDLDGFAENSLRYEFVAEMQLLLREASNEETRAELELALWYGLDALTWGRVIQR